MYLYYYRAVSGAEIPGIHEGDLAVLQRRHEGSVTPITRVILLTPDVLVSVRNCLEAQLSIVPAVELGLIRSLKLCISIMRHHEPE